MFMRGTTRGKEKPEWFALVGAIGLLLVIGGVTGEWVFEGKVSDTSRILSNFDHNQTLIAEQRAGDAATSAERAKAASDAAFREAGDASSTAASALGDAKTVDKKARKLDREMQEAESEMAVLEDKRKKLETALTNLAVCSAPRVIPSWVVDGKTYVDSLRSLKGIRAILIVVSDPEARRAAASLGGALHDAGADIQLGSPQLNEEIPSGVTVESYGFANASRTKSFAMEGIEESRTAALDFVAFLHSYNWQAQWMDGFSGRRDLVPKSIRIAVGLYPPTEFITPPAMEEAIAAMTESERQFEAKRQSDRLQRLNERLKKLPPEEAEAERVRSEAWERQMDSEEKEILERDGDVQPCRPLSPLAQEP